MKMTKNLSRQDFSFEEFYNYLNDNSPNEYLGRYMSLPGWIYDRCCELMNLNNPEAIALRFGELGYFSRKLPVEV